MIPFQQAPVDRALEIFSEYSLTKPKGAKAYWAGLHHYDLLYSLKQEFEKRGWTYTDVRWVISQDQLNLVGTLQLFHESIKPPLGQEILLGFINRNDLKKALCLTAGVLTDGSSALITGEIFLRKKHTTKTKWPEEICNAFCLFEKEARRIPRVINKMRRCLLSRELVKCLLIDSARKRIIPWSHLKQIDWEYQHPSLEELKGKENAWVLYNAFAVAVKKSPPIEQLDRTNRFRKLLPIFNRKEEGDVRPTSEGGARGDIF